MDIISLIINGAILLICAVFLRHTFIRSRYLFQMFQQHGYKRHEFRNWIFSNFNAKILTTEHLFINLVILVLIYFFSEQVTFIAAVTIMSIFSIFWFGPVARYRPEKHKKPLIVTSRVKRQIGVFLAMILPLYYFFYKIAFSELLFYANPSIRESAGSFITADPYFLTFLLVLVDVMVPLLLLISAWIVMPVENYIQEGFKKRARKKLESMPHLKVIAITGSYGKTSTKFVIDAFLKERFNVCTTPGSYNTPMGICKVINNDLEASHQVLILEMGARYEGNIKELCRIAQPDISVITNVGISHLETFGSKEAVAREKGTLAEELKRGGLLVLNGDDPAVREMGNNRGNIRRVLIGNNGTIRAEELSVDANGTRFKMIWLDEIRKPVQSAEIQTRLLGAHNVENMLLAAAVARDFGIRIETIAVAAENMQPVEHRLELKKQGGYTIIDDAFNSNPEGAKNAVEILASFRTGKKFIITPGMIELGEKEEEENRNFGRHIASNQIDTAILIGHERSRPIAEGIVEKRTDGRPEVIVAKSLFEANDIMKKKAEPGDVVLYENDLPDSYNE